MKKGLGLLLAGVLLLSMSACRQDPAPSVQNATTGESIPENQSASHDFSDIDVNITHTADKSAFSQPISCAYGDKTITINPPQYTGIPINAVFYQENYRFRDGNVTLQVSTKTGGRTFLIDKTGQILSDDYTPVVNNTETVKPADIGAEYSAGDGMYVYTNGTTTAEGEMLYGLKDSSGKVITAAQYLAYHICFCDGYAMAQRADGTYVAIDINGEEYGTLPGGSSRGCNTVVVQEGEPGAYVQYLYDIQGNCLSDGYDTISYFFDGLALIKKDNKLGIIDSNGKVILAPTIDYDIVTYPPKGRGFSVDFLNENAFVLPIGGELAVITIQKDICLEIDPEQSPAYNRAITAYNAFLNGQIAVKTKDDSKRLISGYGRISDGQSGIDQYALNDVNNDGIPELIIDAAIDHILAFDGEEIEEWYSSMSWMGFRLLENGAVVDIHSSVGVFFNYLTFGSDGIEKFIHFSSPPEGESGQSYYFGEGESEPPQKVSKDEWETLTKPYLEQAEKTVTLNWTEWR